MNVNEFSLEFDILYNNIKSQSAPGLDEYEKSVCLTQAQDKYVRAAYRGLNQMRESFEETEIKRRYLDRLIRQVELSASNQADSIKISDDSYFFELPEDIMFITNEKVKITSDTECWNNKKLDVVPMRQDEYNTQIHNPFRKPKLTGRTVQAWRLDNGTDAARMVEIVVPENSEATEYIVRYIKKPKPIILTDLSQAPYNNPQVSIDGLTAVTQCELDSVVHREILKRAVEIAKVHYDSPTPQAIMQLNEKIN